MVTNLFATDYYVKSSGSDTNNGTSEATAYSTISKAHTTAIDGDRIYIVGSINQTTQLTLTKALTFTGMSNAVITGASTRLFLIPGTTAKTISFSGITFQNTVITAATTNGAVLWVNGASSVSFTNCVFSGNTATGAGGAIEFGALGNLTITNCTFSNNTAGTNGGAINFIGTATNLTISGSTFTGNATLNGVGGAINAIGSVAGVLSVTTSLFSGNNAVNAANTSTGGAINVSNNLRQTLISYSTFYNNSAILQGGAIYAAGTNATSKFTNITCFQNKVKLATATTDKGGAIRIEGDRPFTIENSLVYGNLVATNGTSIASDIGVLITTSGTSILTLTKSLFGASIGLDAGDSYATSNTAANLTSSNLTWDGTSGIVKFGLPAVGDATPIGFGSDNKDVGAWNCGTRVAPTFTQVAAICSGATLSALPTTSTNGVTGTWSPALDNTTTTEYTFTPSLGQCATSRATMTITVTASTTTGSVTQSQTGGTYTWPANGVTYTETTNTSIITGCNTATLNLTILGANPPTISTLTSNGTTVITQGCGGTTLVITGTDFSGASAVTVNGVALASFDVTNSTTITATLPANSIASGAVTVTTPTGTATSAGNFAVNAIVTPTFTQVAAICSGASLSALPTTSNNTITGTWSPALNNTATTIYTFTPTEGVCITTATMTITVNACPADTFTWNGSSSNDWATAANWTKTGTSPDGYPGQTPGRIIDNVVISNGGTPVVASGTYVIYSLAINNTTGGNTGSILTIDSGATLTVNNTSATAAAVAITLKGGSIVNNGTLNATATNTGASFGIACLVPSVAPSVATEYGYSGSGALNITTTLGNASSGGIQFNGTSLNTTYKMLFNGTATFSLNNTALAVYALRVVDGAKNPIIIGGTGFTLGTVGAPVNNGLLIMGNNGNNVTVNTGTTLTLNSAATNTAMGINILQTTAASADVNFTNKGTISILGASSNCGINLSVNNSGNTLPAINKINFENQGTVNVDLAIGSSSNNAALRVPAAGTTDGLITITNTGTGVLNLKNSQPFTAVTGCPIRIFAAAGTPAVTINNAGALTFTGQSINFGGLATRSTINNTGTINSSSEFQSFTVTNGTAGTINFNYNTPATTRSVTFTVLAGVAASAGATYTDVAGNVYTVVFTKTGTSLVGSFPLTGTTTPAPASLTKTSGTGDTSITYTAITLYEATYLSAANSAFTNNGTVNTGTATNLNTFAAVTTSATSVISPGGASGVGNTDIANASTVVLNGTLKLDIPSIVSSTAFDQITNSATGGGFNITNATLDLTGIFTPVGNRTISILTTNATGTLIGEFSSVIGLGTGWSLNYTTGIAGKVQLVYSTPTTWTGTTSTDWATGTNWTGAGVPNYLTDVTIANVTNQPIIASNVSVASLTLNASTSLTVNTGFNLTVAGAVANNGTITVENNANLIQTALTNTNSGSGTAIVKRNSASINLYDYTLWSSPVAGQKLKAFSPNTLDARFYSYNSSTNQYNVVPAPLTTDFATATGYLIRTPNTWAAGAQTFLGQFTGIPNNGAISVPGLIAGKYYAVGNPYPSTISVASFYTANPNAGTLYFWRRTNGDVSTTAYATRNNAGATSASGGLTPSTDIAVGQGFFVSPSANMDLNFTNAMRGTPSTSASFLRTTEERSRFWLNLTNSSGVFSQMLVGYMPEATSGVDNAIDGKYINDAPIALTSIINAEEYTIQGRALPFSTTDTVPLGFKTNAAGNYTIAIDHVDGLFSTGQTVFLKDNLLNTVTDLSAGGYSFASAIGTFNSRFEVVYQSTLAVTNPTFTANSVIAFSANGEIRINSGSTIMELVRVYDLQGRLLVEKKQINASETKIITSSTNQVLLVEITATNGSKITKKIIQ